MKNSKASRKAAFLSNQQSTDSIYPVQYPRASHKDQCIIYTFNRTQTILYREKDLNFLHGKLKFHSSWTSVTAKLVLYIRTDASDVSNAINYQSIISWVICYGTRVFFVDWKGNKSSVKIQAMEHFLYQRKEARYNAKGVVWFSMHVN